jgi:hypothetical protein
VGLFAISHDASLPTLLRQAGDAAAADHGRSLFGLTLIGIGLVFGIAGSMLGVERRGTGK